MINSYKCSLRWFKRVVYRKMNYKKEYVLLYEMSLDPIIVAWQWSITSSSGTAVHYVDGYTARETLPGVLHCMEGYRPHHCVPSNLFQCKYVLCIWLLAVLLCVQRCDQNLSIQVTGNDYLFILHLLCQTQSLSLPVGRPLPSNH
jgi:hypothetical protein